MNTKTILKHTIKIGFTILILFSLHGCVSVSKVMESWLNHHYSELIGSWGPPTRVYDDGKEGRVLVYVYNRTYTTPGTSTTTTNSYGYGTATVYDNYIWGNANTSTQSTTTYNPPRTYQYTSYRVFYVNKKGYIYKYAWKGL